MEIKTFNEIYKDMRNYIIANQNKLTDFNDGSVLMSQVEAIAREISMLYISCRIGFSSFLRGLPYSVFGFPQKEGTKASVDVVFSRSKPYSYNTPIPVGTIAKAGNLKYITTATGAVLSGAIDTAPIPASAEFVGEKYNTPANTIKTIGSILSADIVAVNNPATATGGENVEDWAAYTDRFADYIVGLQRTNSAGLLTGLSEFVRSMGIKEHFPPIDGLWNMTFYLEDGSGGMTPEALANAKKKIDGNIAKKIGGYRAPGVSVRYETPENIPITISATVRTERDIANEVDQSVIENEVKDELRKYINSRKIGESVQLDNLTVLLKRLSSLSKVEITAPENDIEINEDQIARFQDATVQVVS